MAGRILVVEDSPTQAEALRYALEQGGYAVTVAPDGGAALGLVEREPFDLVISDVTMPGIDGYELCRRIKAESRARDLPVMLLTSLTDPMDIVHGLEAGADNYVTKPYEPEHLLSRVANLLETRRLRRGSRSRVGVNVTFLGSTFTINSDREQILDLLISTFEDAVLQNRQLRRREEELQVAKAELARYAGSLEERLRSVLDSVPDAVFSVSPGFDRVHYLSPACARVLGFTMEQGVADPAVWNQAIEPEDLPRVLEARRSAVADRRRGWVEYRVRRPDLSLRWIEERIVPIVGPDETVIRVDGIARNISERKLAEETLRAQQRLLQDVVNADPSLIFVKDWDGRFLLANRAVAEIYGTTVDALVGKTDADFNPDPAEVAHFLHNDREVMSTGRPKLVPEERVTDRRTGKARWFQTVKVPLTSIQGESRAVLGVATDITDRKRLEEQLRLAQKMEAIGALAGGVAHDFNNLLAAIRGSVDLLLMDVEPASPLRPEVEQIGRVVDLRHLIADASKLLQRVIGADIRLHVASTSDDATVLADPGQLEQVVMNLCVNARDAMPQGGELTLQTDRVLLDENFCTVHPWARPGEYVRLSITDTGVGMDAATQERIFEPFFTTKGPGHGTGLGLAVVYGIVKQHGGLLHVYSEPGRGSTFRIYLPFTSERPQPASAPAPAELPRGSATVLLAEDDDALRATAARLLERLGYRVIPAPDGAAALDLLLERGDEVDVAILDVVMPGLTGPAVLEQIRERRPRLRFLFTTGYSPGTSHTTPLRGLPAPVLHKPYGIEALARAVSRALSG